MQKKKEIAIESNISPNVPGLLEFDKSRLTQVVMNLVGNSIKFTPVKGKVSINISWKWNCGHNNGDCNNCEYSLTKEGKPVDQRKKVMIILNKSLGKNDFYEWYKRN